LAGIIGSHRIHASTGAFSLLFRKLEDWVPSRLTNTLSKRVVLQHPRDVQPFKGNRTVRVQSVRNLTGVMRTLIGHVLMHSSEFPDPCLAALRLLPALIQGVLCVVEFSRRFPRKRYRPEKRFIRSGGECLQPDINPNRGFTPGETVGIDLPGNPRVAASMLDDHRTRFDRSETGSWRVIFTAPIFAR